MGLTNTQLTTILQGCEAQADIIKNIDKISINLV